MPLVTSEGHAIGTLCLKDDTPRSFSERERELLELLAEEAVNQLELRRRNLVDTDE
jgi:GAF domain-containing protein